jgi:hypothetical protein
MSQCPKCGCGQSGVTILQCRECDEMFCTECGNATLLGSVGLVWPKCPDCGGTPLPVRTNE